MIKGHRQGRQNIQVNTGGNQRKGDKQSPDEIVINKGALGQPGEPIPPPPTVEDTIVRLPLTIERYQAIKQLSVGREETPESLINNAISEHLAPRFDPMDNLESVV